MNDVAATYSFNEGGKLVVALHGNWLMEGNNPDPLLVCDVLTRDGCTVVAFDSSNLLEWDSGVLTYLLTIRDFSVEQNVEFNSQGLPAGIRQLIDLARAVPPRRPDSYVVSRDNFLTRVGDDTFDFYRGLIELFEFIGEVFLPTFRVMLGQIRIRISDLGILLQDAGAQAMPIVALISFLVGVILAFIGIMQLELFGAQVYVADLVGIAMVRVMGAVMTGIIMAGRTGASFAAQLGTMQVNEEIDALKTAGISPVEFLVLPRLFALTLMMPLLTLYANLMGIIGGALIASGFYNIRLVVYFNRVIDAVSLNDLFVGLFMGGVFGILVSLCGCLRGIKCGRDASAVGDATTSAVVTSIVAIIIATAIIIVICAILGI